MRTILALLLLTGIASAQQSYIVQNVGGQTFIVPIGPTKGPQNYSQYDPMNPYRINSFDYNGKNGRGQTQSEVEAQNQPHVCNQTIIVKQPRYYPYQNPVGGVTVIVNPFVSR